MSPELLASVLGSGVSNEVLAPQAKELPTLLVPRSALPQDHCKIDGPCQAWSPWGSNAKPQDTEREIGTALEAEEKKIQNLPLQLKLPNQNPKSKTRTGIHSK